jgi:4-aminobutyrate aminotransferase-like enzyme
VEAALKTALLATRRAGIIAFEKGYHGLGYGALNATHREHFRLPFRSQLAEFAHFVPFPANVSQLGRLQKALGQTLRRLPIGAILVEPVQGRGGINIPPAQFLPLLRELCDESGSLLILDEVMTGFGRTGRWFACERTQTIPDLICLGKRTLRRSAKVYREVAHYAACAVGVQADGSVAALGEWQLGIALDCRERTGGDDPAIFHENEIVSQALYLGHIVTQ